MPSLFKYAISRPYPFKGFTYYVLFGGLVAAVLLSYLNFASSGYSLVVEYATDPNATVSDARLKGWSSAQLGSKVQPSCQPANIAVNTDFLTNNSMLTYTLTGVSYDSSDEDKVSAPSLIYHNNLLRNCSIVKIALEMESGSRTALQIGLSGWGADTVAYVTCSIDTAATGRTSINLTTTYNLVPKNAVPKVLIGRNQTSQASLYWGESLLSLYWLRTMCDMDDQEDFDNKKALKGVLEFTPNRTITDIANLDYLDISWRLILDPRVVYFDPDSRNLSTLNRLAIPPNIWSAADSLAKSMYSMVLTDLGQTELEQNILTDPVLLQNFTASIDYTDIENSWLAKLGVAMKDFNTLKHTTGPLGVSPSVLSTNYICQVPRLKSTGTLLLAVLVADLVFLQALWLLTTLVAGWFLDPSANVCEGCLRKADAALIHHNGVPGGAPHKVGADTHEYELVGVERGAKTSVRISVHEVQNCWSNIREYTAF